MLVHIVALLAFYYAVCVFCHTYICRTGQEVRYYHTVPSAPLLGDEVLAVSNSAAVGALRHASGVEDVVGYNGIAGDLGTAVVAEEVLAERIYFRNGVTLRGRTVASPPPLVIDVGAHIGLFALSVLRERADAIVVGAEPVPQLHALAEKNTAASTLSDTADIFIEQMAMGGAYDVGVDLIFDPFLTAGTCVGRPLPTQLPRPHTFSSFYATFRAVGLDSVRAGNFPYFPTVALCHTMKVPVLRELALLLASPLLLLVAIFYLAGPHGRKRVRCCQGPLHKLIERAATRAAESDASEHGTAVARRIRGPDSPIDLVKVDVLGCELGVLEGVTEGEWARIRQLVVQVRDISGRAAAIRKMLAAKGFNHVIVEEDDWATHELFHIKNIYAKKIIGATVA